MYGSRLVSGLAAVFGGIALLFAGFAVVYNPVFAAVTAVFAAVSYFMWYHASGAFARRLYRTVERRARPRDARQQGGFGAGPREDWTPPRDEGRRRRDRANRERRSTEDRSRQSRNRRQRTRRRATAGPSDGPTATQAYRILGLDPGADQQAVRDAYREKVKEVHPDSPSGNEERFKRVKTAYERLADD